MKRHNHYQGEVIDLVRRLFAPEDAALTHARDRAVAADVPLIEVAPEDGALLGLIVRLVQPRRVVEIGTLFGYSAIWMARALPPGAELITIEADARNAAVAEQNLAEAGVADRVTVIAEPAPGGLEGIPDPIDVVFVDADKTGYPAYLAWARDRLRPGGVFLADNAFRGGGVTDPEDAAERAVRETLDSLASDPAWDAAVVPTLEGLALAIRTG